MRWYGIQPKHTHPSRRLLDLAIVVKNVDLSVRELRCRDNALEGCIISLTSSSSHARVRYRCEHTRDIFVDWINFSITTKDGSRLLARHYSCP